MTVVLVIGCIVAVSLTIDLFLVRKKLLRQQRENSEIIFRSCQYDVEKTHQAVERESGFVG